MRIYAAGNFVVVSACEAVIVARVATWIRGRGLPPVERVGPEIEILIAASVVVYSGSVYGCCSLVVGRPGDEDHTLAVAACAKERIGLKGDAAADKESRNRRVEGGGGRDVKRK